MPLQKVIWREENEEVTHILQALISGAEFWLKGRLAKRHIQ